MKTTKLYDDTKCLRFKEFLLARNPSESFAHKYITYLNGSVVKDVVKKIAHVESIFQVNNLQQVQAIYNKVKTNPNNIRLHNVYSGVISAYLKFLEGQDLRKRVIVKNND